MTFNEKVIAVLQERSSEIHDGATKMQIVDATDFEQVAMDLYELIIRDYGIDLDETGKS